MSEFSNNRSKAPLIGKLQLRKDMVFLQFFALILVLLWCLHRSYNLGVKKYFDISFYILILLERERETWREREKKTVRERERGEEKKRLNYMMRSKTFLALVCCVSAIMSLTECDLHLFLIYSLITKLYIKSPLL